MATNNIDSSAFNPKSYFKNYIKDKSIEEVIKKNNEIFSEIRTLDSELQTLVYENYNKFISATDIIKNVKFIKYYYLLQIKKNMNEIDSELVNLRSNLSQINGSYAEIDNTLKFKWKEIKKLDILERDLNKLRYLSELPNMFKLAISKFEAKQEGISAFKEPIRYFEDYSDVLSNYKQTNFMINLYSEIKNYIVRIKFLLSKSLEQNLQSSDLSAEEESKIIIKHLITLGEDKSHLKNLFLKTKAQNIKKKLHLISSSKRSREISYEVYNKINHDEDLCKMERISDGVYDQLQAEVSQEQNNRKNALLEQNFDKNTIKQNFRFNHLLDINDIKFSQVKEGTCLQQILRVSKEISFYILQSIEDYRTLFFFDKEAKKVLDSALKDQEEKEYKKFVNCLLQPFTEEIRVILRQSDIDAETLGESLKIIYRDFSEISKKLSNLRTLAVMDQAKRIIEETIRKQMGSQISQLEQRLFRNIDNINSQCSGTTGKVNIQQIQEMVQSSFNYLMNDISLTIYQYKVLLNYRHSFMKETQILSINIFQSLQNLFELWQKLNLAMVNQVHSQIKNGGQQFTPNDSKADLQIDDYKLREQELLEVAEKTTANGYSIVAYMNIAMKLESFGIQEIYQIVYGMFNEDEFGGQMQRNSYQNGYNDGWTIFETDILPMLQDMMAHLSRILRKKYCLYFSEKINFQIRKYFKTYNWQDMVEPRDIKNEFFEICKSIYQANQCLDLLFGSNTTNVQKKGGKQSNQLQTQLKKPELLVKPKKFNAMEMEMDKFLAKKHQIYQNNDLQRYVLMTNIIHIVLKSLYENVRYHRFNIFGYQQLQTDLYFLFTTVTQVLPNEENNYSQAKLQQPNSVSTTTSVNSKQMITRDWADKVQQDQILSILNTDSNKNSDNLNNSSMNGSMFQQFNDKQKQIQPLVKAPRINSQGSSRSNAQTVNSNLNKTGNQSVNLNSGDISPRSLAKRDLQAFQQQMNQKSKGNNIPRSSTQENQRRRSVRQQLSNQSDLPDLTRSKIQSSFNSGKGQYQQMQSPSEKIISTTQNKIKRRVLGGEGSSTDRLFNQIVKTQDDKQEMNKENVIEDNKISSNNSTKSLMMIQYQNQQPMKAPTSQSSRLPMKLQRSFTQSNAGDNVSSRTSIISQMPSSSMLQQNSQLEKQMKEVTKQKELLMKLQREKDELEKQMQNNEKAIQNRMQKLHQERRQMEEKIIKASTVIQRFARGFIQRLRYKKMIDNQILEDKAKLANVLDELKVQINSAFNQASDQVNDQIDESAIKIQRAARKMIARKNFRISLYKLMLFKNIVENKVHKEKMQMLYAFEQLIINTEDEDDEEYYDEVYGQEDYEGNDFAQGVGGGYPHLSRQFPPTQRVPVEAEYLSNPSDIIDEEEYEDSEEEKEFAKKQIQEGIIAQQNNIKPSTAGGKILNKVTPNDLLEFARKNSAGPVRGGASIQSDDQTNQFEIEIGAGMFGHSKNQYAESSQASQLSTLNSKKRSSSEKRDTDSQKSGDNNMLQSELPKAVSRRIQPRQQPPKQKMLAILPPEPVAKQLPPRPLDMDRIIALSQPKLVPEEEVLPPPPKKKAPKPPMASKPKKKKSKKNQENSEALVLAKPQKKSRRRISRQGGQQNTGGLLNNLERLLKHRESRTSIKMQRQNSNQNQQVFAIEYNKAEGNNNRQQNDNVRLPVQLSQKQQNPKQIQTQSNGVGNDYQRNQRRLELNNEASISSNQDLAEIDSQQNLQVEHKIPQVIQKQDYLEDSQDLTIISENNEHKNQYLGSMLPPIQQNIQQNLTYQHQQQLQQLLQQQQLQLQQQNQMGQSNLQPNTQMPQTQYNSQQHQQPVQQQHQPQQQPQQSDHTQLYKKCFPNATLGFKDRFPVFADILQRYNKNLKHISNAAAVTATNTVKK